MAGTRSASQRKRKRDTTSQTVDFLNNIHSPTDRVSHSSPVRPRRPLRRQSARKTQVRRSDGVLESPRSPEETRSPVSRRSEPTTLRRSSRKTGPVQPDKSSKLGSDSTSGSNENSDYESENDSDESAENTKTAIKRNAISRSSQQPREDENTRRGSLNETPSEPQPDANPDLEIELDVESSGDSSSDSSDGDSDGDSDEPKDHSEEADSQAQSQSIGETSKENENAHKESPSRPSTQEKPVVSISVGEVDDPDDYSSGVSQDKSYNPEENPNSVNGNIQDQHEEVDPTRVILFTSDDEDSDDDDDDDRDARDFSPSQQLQQEQEMNVNSEEVTGNLTVPDHEQGTNVNSEDVAKDTTILGDDQGMGMNSIETTNGAATLEHNPDTNVGSEALAEAAAEETEYSPSGEESSSEGSPAAPGLFRYIPEADDDAPPPETSRENRLRPGNNRRQRTSSASASLENRSNSPDEEAASIASTNSTEKHIDEEESPWFAEAKLLGEQEKNWQILISETLAASKVVRPSRAHYFLQIETLMASLRKEYAAVLDNLKEQRRPSRESQRNCKSLRCSLDSEADQLREMIFYRAAKRDEQNKLLSGKLAGEFEARVYHPMVGIVLQCFEAYRHSDMRRLFPNAKDHFLESMQLLQKFCKRSDAQESRGYVSFRSRGGRLIKVLANLINALQTGALGGRASTAASMLTRVQRRGVVMQRLQQQWSTTQQVDDNESTRSLDLTTQTLDESHFTDSGPCLEQREWTDEEGFALLEGLRRWQGPRRYHQISEQFHSQLGGRTIRELRAKAQQIRDASAPRYEQTAKTQEQRKQWQWLLEV